MVSKSEEALLARLDLSYSKTEHSPISHAFMKLALRPKPINALQVQTRWGHEIEVSSGFDFTESASRGAIALGHDYSLGLWDTDDLVSILVSLFRVSSLLHRIPGSSRYQQKQRRIQQSMPKETAEHYDLPSAFFRDFLGDQPLYSACSSRSLRTQTEQLLLLAEDLCLKPGMTCLDLGAGWGTLAVVLSKYADCKVDAVTISSEQFQYIREISQSNVHVSLEDFTAAGFAENTAKRYGGITLIESFEHVAPRDRVRVLNSIGSLLAPNGRLALQCTVLPLHTERNHIRKENFSTEVIFPGPGRVPSVRTLRQVSVRAGFAVVAEHDLTRMALKARQSWLNSFAKVKNKRQLEKDRFHRLWTFYLAGLVAAIEAKNQGCVRLILERKQ